VEESSNKRSSNLGLYFSTEVEYTQSGKCCPVFYDECSVFINWLFFEIDNSDLMALSIT